MRSKKALLSTCVAFVLQLVNILSALIIPRIIIKFYGSSVNGLIQSITQFLGYISLLQLGVGGVIRAALYRPLAESDGKQISKVVKAAELFFRKIGFVSCIYIIILAIGYPFFTDGGFDFGYISALVVIIGLSTIAQYMFGFPYRLLITADQRSYVYDFTQIIATVLNIIITIVLIQCGFSIQIVKFGSAIVFVIQPIALNYFVSRHYKIDKKVDPDNDAVEQRWAGMGYSLADFVHRKTDIFVLTLLSSLLEVSVYSVYSVVTNGINSVITMATNSFQAALGDMIAKREYKALNENMRLYIYIVHIISTIVFSVALVLIIPFVKIYTSGIQDVNYIRPGFAFLILCAELFYCLRQPYQSVIIAAGKFRETQRGAIIEAALNIIISVILVRHYGIVGVAIGTLVAMIYRTIDLVYFLTKNIFEYSFVEFVKRYILSGATMLIICLILSCMMKEINTYLEWMCCGVVFSFIAVTITLAINFVFYRSDSTRLMKKLKNIFIKRKRNL